MLCVPDYNLCRCWARSTDLRDLEILLARFRHQKIARPSRDCSSFDDEIAQVPSRDRADWYFAPTIDTQYKLKFSIYNEHQIPPFFQGKSVTWT